MILILFLPNFVDFIRLCYNMFLSIVHHTSYISKTYDSLILKPLSKELKKVYSMEF